MTEVELLAALGEHRDVHLWLPHPSAALWDVARRTCAVPCPRRDDDSHERVGHPLLASLGRDVRELQRTLHAGGRDVARASRPASRWFETLDALAPQPPDDPALLAAGTTSPPTPPSTPPRRTLDPDDRCVQVHACHGPARQVEVLREVLLGLLADDPTLEPRDILVMCPDIEAYAPLIAAAFGMGEAIGRRPSRPRSCGCGWPTGR